MSLDVFLSHFLTPGYIDSLSCHVAGLVRGQKNKDVCHVIIRASPAKGNLVEILLSDLFLGDTLVSGVLFI